MSHQFHLFTRDRWIWTTAFLLICLVIVASCYWHYRREAANIRLGRYNDIAAIAELKAQGIAQWRKERLADVWRAANGPRVITLMTELVKTPDASDIRSELGRLLEVNRKGDLYAHVLLFAPDGALLLATGDEAEPVNAVARQTLTAAFASQQPTLSEFYLHSSGIVHLDAAAAVPDAEGRPLAVMLLRSNAEKHLFPLIQTWPIPSRSAETLLVKRQGEEIVFLNELRFRSKTALSLRFPLTQTDLPAVQAALGRRGVFQGKDYRGVEVLADLQPIPNLPWFMVAKVDVREILDEAYYRAKGITLLAILLILLTAAVIAFASRRQQADHFRRLYQYERHQREAQEIFRTTLYSIGDAVITTDTEGRVRQMNPVAEQLTGWLEAEAREKPLEEVFRIANEETRAAVDNPVQRVLQEGIVVGLSNHTILIARDGSERPITDSAAPIRLERGDVIGVVLVFRDQTAERAAQNALQESNAYNSSIIGILPDIIIRVSKEGAYLDIVTHSEDLLLLPKRALLGKNIADVMPAAVSDRIMACIAKTLETGTLQTVEYDLDTPEGSRHFEARLLPQKHGEIIALVRNITTQKQAEENRIARLTAEAANREKSMFLSNMSHEIRTPMNAILGFAQILEHDSSLTPKQTEQIRCINRSGRHLLSLINDILDMSKIEAGMTALHPAVFGLHDLLDDLQMMFRSRADSKGLRLIMERESDVPYHVLGDEGKLRQVLVNLMGNAVKFTRRGGVAVRVRALPAEGPQARDAQRLRLVVEVEDSGPGIPDADLDRIFDAFRQTEAGAKAGGTGLGLTISRRLVEMMGGQLTVRSATGKGSCFRFDVLLARAEEHPDEKQPEARHALGLEPGTGPYRILVVDDAPDNRHLLCALLRPFGFEVQEAENGAKAVHIFQEWSPHAVLMDMRMPVMDGYEATRRIKACPAGRATPVIAVTASAFMDSEKEIEATGVSAYLRKPFRAEELFDLLKECLDLRYVYAEKRGGAAGQSRPSAFTSNALAALPDTLLQAMRGAVEAGDITRLEALIQQVEALDSITALELRALADRYDYTRLDALLRKKGASHG